MDIHESIQRIMRSQDVFGDTFYSIFFERTPEVRVFFKDVDMKRQSLVLTMALSLIEQYYSSGYPATEKYLKYLGTQHHKREIPQDMYAHWRDAMLEALEQTLGDEWTVELKQQWHDACDRCIVVLFEGYREHFTV